MVIHYLLPFKEGGGEVVMRVVCIPPALKQEMEEVSIPLPFWRSWIGEEMEEVFRRR